MATSKTDLQTKSTALKLLTPAISFKYGMDPNTGTITAGSEVTSIYFANVFLKKCFFLIYYFLLNYCEGLARQSLDSY